MRTVLSAVVLIAGVLTTFIGAWGLATFGSMSTNELQEMQMWIAIALLAGGLGLVALGIDRMRTRAL